MATVTKICRVCGKEYEACRSANRTSGVFRWQEVACSPECGAIYLQRINESRGIGTGANSDSRKKTVKKTVKQHTVDAADLSADAKREESASEASAKSDEEI